MNVLFVNYDDFRSNSAVHIFNLARELSSLGHACCIAVPQHKETISTLGIPNFEVRDFGDIRTMGCGFQDKKGPSLIHAWTPREIVRAFVDDVVKLFKCPYVVHLEDNERYLLETALGRPFSELAALPLGQLDSVVPPHLSHPIYSARFLQNAAGITVIIDRLLEFVPSGTPALVTLAGFESELFRPMDTDNALKLSLGIPDGTTTIVYHGNTHAANIAEVRSLYLAAIVLTRTGMPTKVVRLGRDFVSIFDTDPPELTEIEIPVGFQPRGDLPRYLSLADALVQPGIPDAFNDYRLPSKVPEFLAMGKPVVLPRTNIGLRMEDGLHALLLEQGTAFEIAEAIRRIVTDGSLAERLSIGGRGFAQERLMWPAIAKRVEGLYLKVNGRLVAPPTSRTAASVYERYRSFSCPQLSYGTVREFCDSFDHLPLLATMTLDLKDVQRPWVFKAVLGHIPRGSRLLEIGAGEPVVADILSTLGYEVWVVDPYDGRDLGPSDFQGLRKRYPRVRFLRGLFPDACPQDMRFTCIYSISVLEHIPTEVIDIVAAGMDRFLASTNGYLIHAIDHVLRGNGDSHHLRNTTRLLKRIGFDQNEIDQVLTKIEIDIETYFLSAESHNRWRGNTPYDEFPMRKCVSLHICKQMSSGSRK